MAHNTKRAARMRVLSRAELQRIVDAKTLASAAARFELARRGEEIVDPLAPHRHRLATDEDVIAYLATLPRPPT